MGKNGMEKVTHNTKKKFKKAHQFSDEKKAEEDHEKNDKQEEKSNSIIITHIINIENDDQEEAAFPYNSLSPKDKLLVNHIYRVQGVQIYPGDEGELSSHPSNSITFKVLEAPPLVLDIKKDQ